MVSGVCYCSEPAVLFSARGIGLDPFCTASQSRLNIRVNGDRDPAGLHT